MPVNRDCQYCSTRFETSQLRRIFCSDVCKMRYHRENGLACYYCGELADTKDHIFPQRTGNGSGDFVKACKTCNSTLRHLEPLSHERRIQYLIEYTTSRYQLDKPVPEWRDDELEELGPSLRKRIAGKIRERQQAIVRLLHMQAVLHKIKSETTLA